MSTAEYQRRWRAAHGARIGSIGRPVTALCGTVSAYKRHRRHGETPCAACAAVWAEYQRDRYATRKGTK